MNNLIEGVYVVHAPVGYEEHGRRVSTLLAKNQIDFEFVNEGDLTDINGSIEKYFCDDIRDQLSKGAMLCTLSHILCYQKMVDNNNKYALILEDDPHFLKNFKWRLDKVMDEVSSLNSGFIISLENSTLQFPPYRETNRGKFLYPAQAGRCAGAYIIDMQGAKDILHSLKKDKCDQVIDWWHNKLIRNKVIRMYWAHPPLVEQCSLNGMMNATISSRTSGYKRRIAWIAQKIYKTYILRLFK